MHVLLLLTIFVARVIASRGDESDVFTKCLRECRSNVCIAEDKLLRFYQEQDLFLRLFGWTCDDECKYDCMWSAVKWHQDLFIDIPQFYGKWPFVRFLGIQEPLSVFASMLNFAANIYMLKRIKADISNRSPLKQIWLGNAYLNLVAWFWSMVFHTRDVPFTEKMDYYCAFAVILYQVYACFVRFILYDTRILNKEHEKKLTAITFLLVFTLHVGYLHFIKFDYGLNMKVNVVFGVVNTLCWIACSIYEYKCKSLKYVWRIVVCVLLLDLTTIIFEVKDFRPVYWIADAHACWHLSTSIIPFFSIKYFIDDAAYYIRMKILLT